MYFFYLIENLSGLSKDKGKAIALVLQYKRTMSTSSIWVMLMLTMVEVLKTPSAGWLWICLGPIVHKPLWVSPILLFKKKFRLIAFDVKTVKNFESKLDQKPQLYWRLAIPGVDRVPGKWLRRPNNNGCYEDSRQRHIK